MLRHINISNVLFLDIETVSGYPSYEALPERMQKIWSLKAPKALKIYDGSEIPQEDIEKAYQERSAIYAEFGKIVCISVGIVVYDKEDKSYQVRVKSFANEEEAVLLSDFSDLVNKHYNNPNHHYFCGHNIREFDMPYICRRMLINQVPIPDMLDIAGKKPWETKYFLDTMELWKFGDYKSYTKLELLTAVFDIPTPKDDIDGSQVGSVYWKEKDLERIAVYCEKDVVACIQLLLRYQLQPLIPNERITRA